MAYTGGEGELAVRIARDAVEAHVAPRPMRAFPVPPRFNEKAGAFVTLNTHPEGNLRGCIGYPSPFFPLVKALVRAAEGACEDPRFPPLLRDEVDRIVVEVSLLTNPELIEVEKPKDYAKAVTIGVDGLIAAKGPARGLLLPQVPVEWGWGPEEFLSEACMKAGLLPDSWLDESTRIYKFQSEVFAETEPRGAVVRRDLAAEHARH
ncbi:MAG: AMMECR1 domain-containing protein [Euryarchaeota archaeon RBG_16_68_12]|nr:MAG: AMMECR1 domain-containing protein [Euryarchaeota archaeon RBG_16_68_12]